MSIPDEMGLTPEAAQRYEQFFVPAIFHQWPPVLISAAGIGDGHKVLEVGCGTGIFARAAIKLVGSKGSVTGLDLSDSMLGVAREISPDVDFRQGNAINLPFDDSTFDAVVSSFLLMFVPDPVAAVSEMWRVLRPGGRLVVSVWEALGQNSVYAGLVNIARQRIDDQAGDSLAWPFALGEKGKLAEIFRSAGIDQETISVHDGRAHFPSLEDFVRTEIQAWVLADSVDDKKIGAVVADLRTEFKGYCDDDGSVDFSLNAVLAKTIKH
jgi:SAM-dependent methyltransferase